MGKCLKGKSEVHEKDAKYACKKCGAVTDIKGHVCSPEKAGGKKGGKKEALKDAGKVKAAKGEKDADRKIEKAELKLKKAEKKLAKAGKKVEKARGKLDKARS